MRRFLLVTTAALALLAAQPAKADISPGDLRDALFDELTAFGEDMWTILVQVLLAPFEDLPIPSVPLPLPAPITAHVLSQPATVDAAAIYMLERLAERTARVEQMDEAVGIVTDSAATNAAELAALAVAAAAPPTSIAAGQQVESMATIAAANATASNTALIAAMASLDADRALREERERLEAWSAALAANPGGVWFGTRTWEPEKLERNGW